MPLTFVDEIIEAFQKFAKHPIPLDVKLIDEESRNLVEGLEVNNKGLAFGESEGTFSINDAKGTPWEVYVKLAVSRLPGHSRSATEASAKLFPEEQQAVIALILDDTGLAISNDLAEYDGRILLVGESEEGLDNKEYSTLYKARIEAVKNALMHELTHISDPQAQTLSPEQYVPYPDADEIDFDDYEKGEAEYFQKQKEYYSQAVEVRAWIRELVTDMAKVAEPGDDFYTILNKSSIWNHLQGNLDEAAKKHMLQAAYTWFSENQ